MRSSSPSPVPCSFQFAHHLSLSSFLCTPLPTTTHLLNINQPTRVHLARDSDFTQTMPADRPRTTSRRSNTPATKETGRAPGTTHSTQEKTLAEIPPVPAQTTTMAFSAAMSEFLDEVAQWNESSQDLKKVLTAAFDASDYYDCIANLRARNIEPLLYINNLNKV